MNREREREEIEGDNHSFLGYLIFIYFLFFLI